LLLILLSFGLLALMWTLSAWRGGVRGEKLRLSHWLFRWLLGSSDFYRCWEVLCGCLWLGCFLDCFEDLCSGHLGWAFDQKLFSKPLLWWQFMGVPSNSQMVGANVGVRSLEANDLPTEMEINSDDMKWVTLKMMQNSLVPTNVVPVQVYL
jgi:hypothetical protein